MLAGRSHRHEGVMTRGCPCIKGRHDAVQELAWASYALLRNTNTAGLLLYASGRVWVARGALGPAATAEAGSEAALRSIAEVFALPP
jgi:hypothetical protein